MPVPLNVLVVGAGVAGLAAATAMRRRGLAVDIIERRQHSPEGAGAFLPGNAMRALTELGLGDRLSAFGMPIRAQQLRDHRGRVLTDIDMARLWRNTGECLGIPHAVLSSALRDNLRENFATTIRTGTTIGSIVQRDDGVDVEFSNGRTGRYDVVVGADGIHSDARHYVDPDAAAGYVGQVCWRFLTDNTVGIDRWTAWLGRGTTFLALPVAHDRLYCYADVSTDSTTASGEMASTLAQHFFGFDSTVRTLLAAAADREVHFAAIEEVGGSNWSRGSVVLIGDAAHASSPNVAQGVAMAAEDALVLAESLADTDSIGAALDRYRRRLPRTRWVQSATHRRDRTRATPPAVRNAVLRLAAGRLFERDYAPLREAP